MKKRFKLLAALAVIPGVIALGINQKVIAQGGDARTAKDAAEKTFVPPGKTDDYYLFYSGGHSGQVFVAGVPSMRHISTIPVFTPYPGTGYG